MAPSAPIPFERMPNWYPPLDRARYRSISDEFSEEISEIRSYLGQWVDLEKVVRTSEISPDSPSRITRPVSGFRTCTRDRARW